MVVVISCMLWYIGLQRSMFAFHCSKNQAKHVFRYAILKLDVLVWLPSNGWTQKHCKYCFYVGVCFNTVTMCHLWLQRKHVVNWGPGVGVTEPISSIPLFSYFFNITKIHVSYWISRLYLTGVAAAQLRWHLLNMNQIQRTWQVLLRDRKFCYRRNWRTELL